jgi:hypothetical protein
MTFIGLLKIIGLTGINVKMNMKRKMQNLDAVNSPLKVNKPFTSFKPHFAGIFMNTQDLLMDPGN